MAYSFFVTWGGIICIPFRSRERIVPIQPEPQPQPRQCVRQCVRPCAARNAAGTTSCMSCLKKEPNENWKQRRSWEDSKKMRSDDSKKRPDKNLQINPSRSNTRQEASKNRAADLANRQNRTKKEQRKRDLRKVPWGYLNKISRVCSSTKRSDTESEISSDSETCSIDDSNKGIISCKNGRVAATRPQEPSRNRLDLSDMRDEYLNYEVCKYLKKDPYDYYLNKRTSDGGSSRRVQFEDACQEIICILNVMHEASRNILKDSLKIQGYYGKKGPFEYLKKISEEDAWLISCDPNAPQDVSRYIPDNSTNIEAIDSKKEFTQYSNKLSCIDSNYELSDSINVSNEDSQISSCTVNAKQEVSANTPEHLSNLQDDDSKKAPCEYLKQGSCEYSKKTLDEGSKKVTFDASKKRSDEYWREETDKNCQAKSCGVNVKQEDTKDTSEDSSNRQDDDSKIDPCADVKKISNEDSGKEINKDCQKMCELNAKQEASKSTSEDLSNAQDDDSKKGPCEYSKTISDNDSKKEPCEVPKQIIYEESSASTSGDLSKIEYGDSSEISSEHSEKICEDSTKEPCEVSDEDSRKEINKDCQEVRCMYAKQETSKSESENSNIQDGGSKEGLCEDTKKTLGGDSEKGLCDDLNKRSNEDLLKEINKIFLEITGGLNFKEEVSKNIPENIQDGGSTKGLCKYLMKILGDDSKEGQWEDSKKISDENLQMKSCEPSVKQEVSKKASGDSSNIQYIDSKKRLTNYSQKIPTDDSKSESCEVLANTSEDSSNIQSGDSKKKLIEYSKKISCVDLRKGPWEDSKKIADGDSQISSYAPNAKQGTLKKTPEDSSNIEYYDSKKIPNEHLKEETCKYSPKIESKDSKIAQSIDSKKSSDEVLMDEIDKNCREIVSALIAKQEAFKNTQHSSNIQDRDSKKGSREYSNNKLCADSKKGSWVHSKKISVESCAPNTKQDVSKDKHLKQVTCESSQKIPGKDSRNELNKNDRKITCEPEASLNVQDCDSRKISHSKISNEDERIRSCRPYVKQEASTNTPEISLNIQYGDTMNGPYEYSMRKSREDSNKKSHEDSRNGTIKVCHKIPCEANAKQRASKKPPKESSNMQEGDSKKAQWEYSNKGFGEDSNKEPLENGSDEYSRKETNNDGEKVACEQNGQQEDSENENCNNSVNQLNELCRCSIEELGESLRSYNTKADDLEIEKPIDSTSCGLFSKELTFKDPSCNATFYDAPSSNATPTNNAPPSYNPTGFSSTRSRNALPFNALSSSALHSSKLPSSKALPSANSTSSTLFISASFYSASSSNVPTSNATRSPNKPFFNRSFFRASSTSIPSISGPTSNAPISITAPSSNATSSYTAAPTFTASSSNTPFSTPTSCSAPSCRATNAGAPTCCCKSQKSCYPYLHFCPTAGGNRCQGRYRSPSPYGFAYRCQNYYRCCCPNRYQNGTSTSCSAIGMFRPPAYMNGMPLFETGVSTSIPTMNM